MARRHRLEIPRTLDGLRRRAREMLRAEEAFECPPKEVLRPELLAGLKRLDLRAKVLLGGFLQGLHRNPRRGFSAEFSDYRNFVAGDDPRWIDWRLYARTDRLFVKRFEAESAMRATMVVDASASMHYRSPAPAFRKLGYAVTLAAALAYLLLHQRDRVGLFCVGGAGAGGYLPPRSSRNHVLRVLRELSSLRAGGDASLASALGSLAEYERRRGMVIIFSDGLCGRADVIEALRRLKHRGHDLIFFQIWDPAELDPPFEPEVSFRDPESGGKYAPLPRGEYLRRAREHLREIRRGCLSVPCEHQLLLTTTAFDRALIKFLRLRRRRH